MELSFQIAKTCWALGQWLILLFLADVHPDGLQKTRLSPIGLPLLQLRVCRVQVQYDTCY